MLCVHLFKDIQMIERDYYLTMMSNTVSNQDWQLLGDVMRSDNHSFHLALKICTTKLSLIYVLSLIFAFEHMFLRPACNPMIMRKQLL